MEYQYQGLKVCITEDSIGKPFIRVFNQDGYRLSSFSVFNPDKSKEMADAAAEHLSRHLGKLGMKLPSKIAGPIASLCAEQDPAVANEMIEIANALPTDGFWDKATKAVEAVDVAWLDRFTKELILVIHSKGGKVRPETLKSKLRRRKNLVAKLNELTDLLGSNDEFNEITLPTVTRLCEQKKEKQNDSDKLSGRNHSMQAPDPWPSSSPGYSGTTLQAAMTLLSSKLTSDVEQMERADGTWRWSNEDFGFSYPLFSNDRNIYRGQLGSKGEVSKHTLFMRVLFDHFEQYTQRPQTRLVALIMGCEWPEFYQEGHLDKWGARAESCWKDYKRLKANQGERGAQIKI